MIHGDSDEETVCSLIVTVIVAEESQSNTRLPATMAVGDCGWAVVGATLNCDHLVN